MKRAARYAAGLSFLEFNHETVAALYRFTLLLRGDAKAAEQALLDVLNECASHVEQIRIDKNRTAFLVKKIRERCLKSKIESQEMSGEKNAVAARNGEFSAGKFSTMPEPERSALALFYLDVFPVREIATLLDMSLEDLSDALENGREFLRSAGMARDQGKA